MENNKMTTDINHNVIEYLDYYIDYELDNPQFAVMLTGKWGCGKTFFIKNELQKWKNKDVVSDEELKRNPIFISLYGISNIKQLIQKLKEEISPIWHSKGAKVLKEVGLGLLKATAKIDLKSGDNSTIPIEAELNLLDVFKDRESKIKGNKLIIFDDLERSEIPINQLFGFVNEFVEHHKCKVILVCDEEKLKKQNSITQTENEENKPYKLEYKDFKEKLVGQTLSINADYKNAVTIFINDKADKQKAFYEDNKELILDVFKASDKENLRVLRQFFSDFERFIEPIETKFEKHNRYDIVKLSLLVHYLIHYVEYKTGNVDIIEWGTGSELMIFSELVTEQKETGTDPILEKKKKEFKSFDKKYYKFIDENSPIKNIRILDYKQFNQQLVYGTPNYNLIIEKISKNSIINKPEKQDWERLYGWKKLDNKDFIKLRDQELKKFQDKKIDDIGVLTHLYFIFLTLDYHEILDDSSELDELYKKNVEKIIDNNQNEYIPQISNDYYSLRYQNQEIKEKDNAHEAIKYVNSLILNHQEKFTTEKITSIVESLGNGNIDKLVYELENRTALGQKVFWEQNIFKDVDLSKLIKKFKSLDSSIQYEFMYMLKNKRYRNVQLIKTEKEHLEEFNSKLMKESEDMELVEKVRFKDYVKIIGQIISKNPD